jgi:CHAD domain-containing protein
MREFATAETSDLLKSAAKAIRKAASEPNEEAVHKMRVSIRRLQQSLRIFGQFFRSKGLRRVKADLKAVMQPAGELRNSDIALKLTGTRSSASRVLRARREQQEASLIAVLAQVAGEDLDARWASDLASRGRRKKKNKRRMWRGRQTVRQNLQRRAPALVSDYFRAGDQALQPGRSWEEMHRFRLLTKRFRYTLELLRPAYGKALESKIELLKQVQTLLGDINDAVVTSGGIAEIPGTERIRARLAVKADRLTHELRALWSSRFAGPSHRETWSRYLVRYACIGRQAPAAAPATIAADAVTSGENVTQNPPNPSEGGVY